MARKDVKAEVTGRVWQVEVTLGQRVAAEDVLIILESMKMEIPVLAPVAGTVAELRVEPEQAVEEGAVVAIIET